MKFTSTTIFHGSEHRLEIKNSPPNLKKKKIDNDFLAGSSSTKKQKKEKRFTSITNVCLTIPHTSKSATFYYYYLFRSPV